MSTPSARAREYLAHRKGGVIASADVAEICGKTPLEEAMVELIDVAAGYAMPQISKYRVGAVALGKSRALYLGANFEFAGASLSQTVHAEQCLVSNAASAEEQALERLFVSTAPCGHCRQFLNELIDADKLQVVIADGRRASLPDLLPDAFGPGDLDVEGTLLSPQDHELSASERDDLGERAARAANASYAPYSKAPGGAVILYDDGACFTGFYIENAAFNPSLPPFQSAFAVALMAGRTLGGISAVVLAQRAGSAIDHAHFAEQLLRRVARDAEFRKVEL